MRPGSINEVVVLLRYWTAGNILLKIRGSSTGELPQSYKDISKIRLLSFTYCVPDMSKVVRPPVPAVSQTDSTSTLILQLLSIDLSRSSMMDSASA